MNDDRGKDAKHIRLSQCQGGIDTAVLAYSLWVPKSTFKPAIWALRAIRIRWTSSSIVRPHWSFSLQFFNCSSLDEMTDPRVLYFLSLTANSSNGLLHKSAVILMLLVVNPCPGDGCRCSIAYKAQWTFSSPTVSSLSSVMDEYQSESMISWISQAVVRKSPSEKPNWRVDWLDGGSSRSKGTSEPQIDCRQLIQCRISR